MSMNDKLFLLSIAVLLAGIYLQFIIRRYKHELRKLNNKHKPSRDLTEENE